MLDEHGLMSVDLRVVDHGAAGKYAWLDDDLVITFARDASPTRNA